MTLTTKKALIAYAEMMNTLNSDNFIKLLADDFVFNSQWVFEEISNKQDYINYINAKFETIRTTQAIPAAELGIVNAYGHKQCVVIAQPTRDDLTATVFIDVADGKIKQLSMCLVPSPYSVKRTGIYPIPDNYMETMELEGTTLEQIVYVDRNVFYKNFSKAVKADKKLADSIAQQSLKLLKDTERYDCVYIEALSNEEVVALIRTLMILDQKIFDGDLKSDEIATTLLAQLKSRNFLHYKSISDWVQKKLSEPEKIEKDNNEDAPLVNTALAKLVAIVNGGYYDELIAMAKNDDEFIVPLIAFERLINSNYALTTGSYSEEFLDSINDFDLDALIRIFTTLDGKIDQFTFGSTTPVPNLLSRLLSNFTYSGYEELVIWVYQNRTNPYILPAKIFQLSEESIEIKSLELFKQYGLYEKLRLKIINLNKKNIYVEKTQNYFGFKLRIINKSFANVYVQSELIRIHLSSLPEYADPKKLLKSVPYKEWGALRNYVEIKNANDLDDAMKLVEQSFFTIAQLKEQKLFNLLDSPQKKYGSEASFLKKANEIVNLLNEFVNEKKITEGEELRIVTQFTEVVKNNNELSILLFEEARELRSLLEILTKSEWLADIKKVRIKKFINESTQRLNRLCLD